MVKARKNRQPKPWDKMTQERSHTGIIKGASENRAKATDLPLELQMSHAKRRVTKHACHLSNLIKKKAATKEADQLAVLENKVRKEEKYLLRAQVSVNSLETRIITRNKREQAAKLTLKFQMQEAIQKNKEHSERVQKEKEESLKIRSSDQVPFLDSIRAFRPEKPLGKIRTYVVKDSKGKKTVKRKWMDNRDKK